MMMKDCFKSIESNYFDCRMIFRAFERGFEGFRLLSSMSWRFSADDLVNNLQAIAPA